MTHRITALEADRIEDLIAMATCRIDIASRLAFLEEAHRRDRERIIRAWGWRQLKALRATHGSIAEMRRAARQEGAAP